MRRTAKRRCRCWELNSFFFSPQFVFSSFVFLFTFHLPLRGNYHQAQHSHTAQWIDRTLNPERKPTMANQIKSLNRNVYYLTRALHESFNRICDRSSTSFRATITLEPNKRNEKKTFFIFCAKQSTDDDFIPSWLQSCRRFKKTRNETKCRQKCTSVAYRTAERFTSEWLTEWSVDIAVANTVVVEHVFAAVCVCWCVWSNVLLLTFGRWIVACASRRCCRCLSFCVFVLDRIRHRVLRSWVFQCKIRFGFFLHLRFAFDMQVDHNADTNGANRTFDCRKSTSITSEVEGIK